MSEWISVEDKLTEPYIDVLVFDGCDVDKDFLGVCCHTLTEYFVNLGDNVTHWMHLPEHP